MTKNEFNLHNEILYIRFFYKKIKINPKMKVKSFTSLYTKYSIIIFTFILYLIFCYICGNRNIYYIISAFLLGLFLLVLLYSLFKCFKMRKAVINSDEIFKIDMSEEGIKTLEENKILKWENIIAITINKYSICLLPKDYPKNDIICWMINQKEEFIEKLKKYDKLDLLVDNSALYD